MPLNHSSLGLYDTARAQYDTKLSALQGEILTMQTLLQRLHDDIERLRQDGGGPLLITHEATLWGHWRAITKLIAHLQILQGLGIERRPSASHPVKPRLSP